MATKERWGFTESAIEDAALPWLESLGYAVKLGPEIAAGDAAAEWSGVKAQA